MTNIASFHFRRFPLGSRPEIHKPLQARDLRQFNVALPSKKSKREALPDSCLPVSRLLFHVPCPLFPFRFPPLPALPVGKRSLNYLTNCRYMTCARLSPPLPSKKSKKGSADCLSFRLPVLLSPCPPSRSAVPDFRPSTFDLRLSTFDLGPAPYGVLFAFGSGFSPVSGLMFSRSQMLRKRTGLPWNWIWSGSRSAWAM